MGIVLSAVILVRQQKLSTDPFLFPSNRPLAGAVAFMPLLISINIHSDTSEVFDEGDKRYLIAAFNRTPTAITVGNILHRRNRPWLLQVVEDLNGNRKRAFDVIDVITQLNLLNKAGRLRHSGVFNTNYIDSSPDSGETVLIESEEPVQERDHLI